MASSIDADAGFITPMLGGVAVALTLVVVASSQLVRTESIAARRDWERRREAHAAEGVAVLATWKILHATGSPTLGWVEQSSLGPMTVQAEPEALKLSITEAAGPRGVARLELLLGQDDGARVARALTDLPISAGPPRREAIRAISRKPIWRACGLSAVSSFSRLTDNALAAPQPPAAGEIDLRAGEPWRIVIAVEGRVLVDRIVRLTGDPGSPAAIVDDIDGGRSSAAHCVELMNSDKGAGA